MQPIAWWRRFEPEPPVRQQPQPEPKPKPQCQEYAAGASASVDGGVFVLLCSATCCRSTTEGVVCRGEG